jgi:histidinol dehydrogenase
VLRTLDARTAKGRTELERLLSARRAAPDFRTLREVLPVVEEILRKGREPLARYVRRFDGASLPPENLLVDPSREPSEIVDGAFAGAFRLARRRIASYHRRQVPKGFSFEDALGVRFVEKPFPVDSVGVYVPGGRAFYPSSLLMGVVPAQIAGVSRIVVATPPRAWRGSRELRWALRELGIREVLLAGGAHGIAGLVSVAGCSKIVGPGNRFVAAAKQLVSHVAAVDLPAGPSELLVVASRDAPAALVAADLLAQAEHDPDALCLLFTSSERLARAVRSEASAQLRDLDGGPASRVIREAFRRRGRIVVFADIGRAVFAAAAVAAEHVEVMGKAAEKLGERLLPTAGALFLGARAGTAFGDYVAGPNHVLPTGGAARSFSGLSARDFFRWGRGLSMSPSAVRRLGGAAATLARFEGLAAHERSVRMRLR